MKIRVALEERGFIVTPNPAMVLVGEPIEWELVAVTGVGSISWRIYFDHGTPFRPNRTEFDVSTQFSAPQNVGSIQGVTHVGSIGPFPAQDDGDYKYGVRASDI